MELGSLCVVLILLRAVAAFRAEGLDGGVTELDWVRQTRVPCVACADALIVSSVRDVTGARCLVCFHGHAGISLSLQCQRHSLFRKTILEV